MSRLVPLLVLLVLSPVVVDVLFGATPISTLVALIPEILTYGCIAIVFRELVRRRGRGWRALVLLGLAYALIEECVIVQTSLAPMPGGDGSGRAFGVNWIYLVWALGYECVWSILIPVQLVDITFGRTRGTAWLRRRGLVVVALVFVVGAVVAWHTWTRVVRVGYLHQPPYSPPLLPVVAAVVLAVVLTCAALLSRSGDRYGASERPVPSPTATAFAATGLGVLWFASTVMFPHLGTWTRVIHPVVPALVACAVAATTFVAFHRWTSSHRWHDGHRLAAIAGALVASMGCGYVVNAFPGVVDLVGKSVLDVAALGWLAVLYHRRRRFRGESPPLTTRTVRS